MNMIRRGPVTLADRHARASLRANVAIVNFTETANALDAASDELDLVAGEAREQAAEFKRRALEATAEATRHAVAAGKIRELIGVS